MSIKSFSEILTESCGKKNLVLQCTVLLFWNYLIFFLLFTKKIMIYQPIVYKYVAFQVWRHCCCPHSFVNHARHVSLCQTPCDKHQNHPATQKSKSRIKCSKLPVIEINTKQKTVNKKTGQNISHLTQCISTQHSMGMLGIPDATQYTSRQALYPQDSGCRREVSDEFVGRSGFGSTKQSAASATQPVTLHRPGSRFLFWAPWPLR